MSPSYRTILAALMFLTVWANYVVGHSFPSPNLQVSVFNRAQVPEDKLKQAEARAEKIMSRAGIHLTWLNCPVSATAPGNATLPSSTVSQSCRAIHYPEHIAITILGRPTNIPADTFGEAFLNEQGTGSYIDVFYEQLSALRLEEAIAPAEILGCVIAHEIGHLELGADSHSKNGLMRAHWDSKSLSDAAKGQLLFSPSQVAAMHTTLTSASREPRVRIASSEIAEVGMP